MYQNHDFIEVSFSQLFSHFSLSHNGIKSEHCSSDLKYFSCGLSPVRSVKCAPNLYSKQLFTFYNELLICFRQNAKQFQISFVLRVSCMCVGINKVLVMLHKAAVSTTKLSHYIGKS